MIMAAKRKVEIDFIVTSSWKVTNESNWFETEMQRQWKLLQGEIHRCFAALTMTSEEGRPSVEMLAGSRGRLPYVWGITVRATHLESRLA